MEYEKRIVCFMDILGFKSIVTNSVNDKDERDRIFELLNSISNLYKNFQGNRVFTVVPESELKDGFAPKKVIDTGLQSEMSFFSDSFIFSYRLKDARTDLMDIMIALHDISFFVFQLLLQGVFIRGGLSFGEVYHKDNICFGPALLKSVELEGTTIYPRISIDPLFFNPESPNSVYYGIEKINKRNREFIEDTYHCVDISDGYLHNTYDLYQIRLENNVIHYLDFLDPNINYELSRALQVKEVIERELKKDYSQHIAEKYIWFKNYYNSVVYNVQCMEEARIV